MPAQTHATIIHRAVHSAHNSWGYHTTLHIISFLVYQYIFSKCVREQCGFIYSSLTPAVGSSVVKIMRYSVTCRAFQCQIDNNFTLAFYILSDLHHVHDNTFATAKNFFTVYFPYNTYISNVLWLFVFHRAFNKYRKNKFVQVLFAVSC